MAHHDFVLQIKLPELTPKKHHQLWRKLYILFLEDIYICIITLLETNIAPECWWLEDEFPFGMAYFQGRAVSFRESICFHMFPS